VSHATRLAHRLGTGLLAAGLVALAGCGAENEHRTPVEIGAAVPLTSSSILVGVTARRSDDRFAATLADDRRELTVAAVPGSGQSTTGTKGACLIVTLPDGVRPRDVHVADPESAYLKPRYLAALRRMDRRGCAAVAANGAPGALRLAPSP
jgi:hypothetical protein